MAKNQTHSTTADQQNSMRRAAKQRQQAQKRKHKKSEEDKILPLSKLYENNKAFAQQRASDTSEADSAFAQLEQAGILFLPAAKNPRWANVADLVVKKIRAAQKRGAFITYDRNDKGFMAEMKKAAA